MERDPERALALSYAPPPARDALSALFALDDALGQILRTTRDPLVGQIRLTWWYDALSALDSAPPPAQPVLQALAAAVLPRGVTGTALAQLIDGWEILLDPDPLDAAALDSFATARGAALFEQAGVVLGARASDPLAQAGCGWALADLALHSRDCAAEVRTMALAALETATTRRWSAPARTLGAVALSARMTLAVPPGEAVQLGSPRRVARLAWHRLTGW